MNSWEPTCSISTLKARAQFIQEVRRYFVAHEVTEVDTPMLSNFGSTDVHLAQMQTTENYTLHTSPELAMKRLLAAGSGDIFQICHVFRKDELSRRHNPEFTMLEWYRVGWDEWQLMDEVVQLIELFSGHSMIREQFSYQEAFLKFGLPDPFVSSDEVLMLEVARQLNADTQNWTRDDCLDALMSSVVEPQLSPESLIFIHSYPPSQAALAKFGELNGHSVGRRFELYWQGMELANGYFELTDVAEQKKRFQADIKKREQEGLEVPKMDGRFLAALANGLPSCSGVAMGLDRVMMILQGKNNISEVIPFSIKNA